MFEYEEPKKMKYTGESNEFYCINGKIYECIGEEDDGMLRIVDESGEDYLYPSDYFEEVKL